MERVRAEGSSGFVPPLLPAEVHWWDVLVIITSQASYTTMSHCSYFG
jgi:hypothetical protein